METPNITTVRFVVWMAVGAAAVSGATVAALLGGQEWIENRLAAITAEVATDDEVKHLMDRHEQQVADALLPVQRGLEGVANRLQNYDRRLTSIEKRELTRKKKRMLWLSERVEMGDNAALRELRELLKEVNDMEK